MQFVTRGCLGFQVQLLPICYLERLQVEGKQVLRTIRISKRTVESLQVGTADLDFFDEDLKGFGVRVRISGRKTYFVLKRHREVLRRFTIEIGRAHV